MKEQIENSEYRACQHFISNSKWDYEDLQKQVAQNASELMCWQKEANHLPVGYIVDESAHLKKGKKSVGVGRQYAEVIGKVDNCPVGVFASLVNGESATIINERVFLPEEWTITRTKQFSSKSHHSRSLRQKQVREENPRSLKQVAVLSVLNKLQMDIPDDEWKLENIRDTVKGKLRLWVYKKEVWTWDGESAKAKKRVLIITKTTDPKPKVRYSISNGDIDANSHGGYAYFVCQRYWVERSFDNAKNELGMSDYKIRKWQSWHTHYAIIILASLLITTKLIECKEEIPLLSFKDARIMIVNQICTIQIEMENKIRQMQKRHVKRKADIDCQEG